MGFLGVYPYGPRCQDARPPCFSVTSPVADCPPLFGDVPDLFSVLDEPAHQALLLHLQEAFVNQCVCFFNCFWVFHLFVWVVVGGIASRITIPHYSVLVKN